MGGDVIPTETFEVNEESDVIFVIIEEGTILDVGLLTCQVNNSIVLMRILFIVNHGTPNDC